MACNSCAKSFSLLRKEKGCPGCGFSYCSKCLDKKIFLPKLNAEAKVCAKCRKNVSTTSNEPNTIVAPDAYYRRIGAMDGKQDDNKSKDPVDQQIVERLQKLKAARKEASKGTTEEDIRKRLDNIKGETSSCSEAELYTRLAKLKGVPIEVVAPSKPLVIKPDTRSEQEQANDLLKQYMDQTNIDTKYNDQFNALVGDIENRMLKLKGSTPSAQSTSKVEDTNVSEDEEETVDKIVKKIAAEVTLEDDEIAPSTNDELPFCEICNEDATMRCLGCRYLFCKRCFMEHRDDDDGCNRYEPYKPPNNS